MLMMAERKTLFVVSDGRGQTGTAVLKAALVQFDAQACELRCVPNVRTIDAVRSVMQAAAAAKGIVFYTLVADETRKTLRDAAIELEVPAIDILGAVLTVLHDLLQSEPRSEPGLLYLSERAQFDRHDAIDFTLKHDDGLGQEGLPDADVVIVGASRVGKSSACFFLASRGIKAANVPFVPGVGFPDTLFRLPKRRVVLLTVNARRLIVLRETRAQNVGISKADDYVNYEKVVEEVRAAHRIALAHGWGVIDVSYRAVEEIVREIVSLCEFPSA